jgi:hypothetical protein
MLLFILLVKQCELKHVRVSFSIWIFRKNSSPGNNNKIAFWDGSAHVKAAIIIIEEVRGKVK